MAKDWSADELEYLEKNYYKNDIADLIAKIGRTEDAIRWKASQIGVLQRDGRDYGPIRKITIGVSESHYNFLKRNKHNQSDVLRKAIDLYIKNSPQ